MGTVNRLALALVAAVLGLPGCARRVPVSLERPAADGPFWPSPPDTPRVGWVASLVMPGTGFGRPLDVACGREHQVAVADPDAGAVWLVDLERGRYRVRRTAGGEPLGTPVAVDVGGDGRLFVSDPARNAVFVASSARRPLRRLVQGPPISRPTGLHALADGGVLVVDSGSHRIWEVPAEGGAPVVRGGGRGGIGEGFNFPVDVVTTPWDELLVADSLNAAVQVVDASGSIRFLAGGAGPKSDQLVRPKGLAVDALGQVHLVDAGMQHVQVYDQQGRLLGRYGRPGDGPGELALPGGICIDEHHHIFVADSLNRRVEVYLLLFEGGG